MRDMLLEELMSIGVFLTKSNIPVNPPALEPVQEIPEVPPEQPRANNLGGDGQSQTFLNIGKAIFPYSMLFVSV